MAIHSVVRLDNVEHAPIESVRFYDSDALAAIDNGRVVKLDTLIDSEVFKAVTPAASTPIAEVVLVASPELMYDERLVNMNEFFNEVDGVAARGYGFYNGMKFSVTKDAFEGTPAVGNVVELDAGIKMKIVPSATEGSTKIGRVIAIETVGSYEYVVVRVEL